MLRLSATALLAGLLMLPGCRGITDSNGGVPEDQLVFIRAAAGAPPLETHQVQFWAVKGEDRRAEIRYLFPNGATAKCLRFRVRPDALARRPDGTAFRMGDSILITIQVEDPAQFRFRFAPEGLRFNAREPAELEVSYRYADRDFNGDGVVDERDEQFEFGFWMQEASGLPWHRVDSRRLTDLEDVDADVTSFTGYALAGAH
jgi:hypothetical protein